MTAQHTSVDVHGMIAAQGKFQNALDQVNTYYSSMTEQQANLAANWVGETASAFGMAVNQWLDDFGAVRAQLTNLIETLSQATGVYANTDEGSQQVVAAFKQGLSGLAGLGI